MNFLTNLFLTFYTASSSFTATTGVMGGGRGVKFWLD